MVLRQKRGPAGLNPDDNGVLASFEYPIFVCVCPIFDNTAKCQVQTSIAIVQNCDRNRLGPTSEDRALMRETYGIHVII